MQITGVHIRRIDQTSKVKAYVSVTLDDEFAVHEIKVIEGEKGLFIAMPSRKTLNGEFLDICHPINQEFRGQVEKIILNEYLLTKE